MKHIVKVDKGRYVHLDSYGESNVSHYVGQVLCAIVVLAIAAITAGALVGVDISNPNPATIHESRR
jgi:hypothetical protein